MRRHKHLSLNRDHKIHCPILFEFEKIVPNYPDIDKEISERQQAISLETKRRAKLPIQKVICLLTVTIEFKLVSIDQLE